jgi:hypothetical protein
MKTTRMLLAAAALAAAAVAGPAHAGRSCEAQKLTTQAVERGMTLAERTHRALEAEHERRGTRVVVLARAGQDLTKWNLHWSHLGWAYREERDGAAAWRVVHKLNHCGSAEAAIYRQGLGEFFLDDLWRAEAAYAVPAPGLQDALWPVLRDDARATALHQRAYNLVSYPWAVRYQQSNQWAMETLAATQVPAPARRERAQAWLKVQGYEPTVLRIGPLTRLGGRITAANIAFDDHPNEKRFSDRIETVTVDSVFQWMRRSGLAGDTVVLRAD